MIEFLTSIDNAILLGINGLHFEALDTVMYWISARTTWIPLYLFLVWVLVKRFGWKRGMLIVVLAGIAVGLTDIIAFEGIKCHVQRLRPSNLDNPISQYIHIVNGKRGGPYGFPSNHAANCAALSIFIYMQRPRRWLGAIMLTWTLLNCYSRMYLGVHYPSDILAGLAVGLLIGSAVAYCSRRYVVATMHPDYHPDMYRPFRTLRDFFKNLPAWNKPLQ